MKKVLNYVLIEKEIVNFIKDQLLKDKKEYKGHIPTKYNKGSEWSDFSWIVTEINMFLNKDFLTSYLLRNFANKYEYNLIKVILINNFKQEYEYTLNNLLKYKRNEN